MSNNSEKKSPLQFPKAHQDMLKLLFPPANSPKSEDTWFTIRAIGKAEHPHKWEAET